MANRTIVPFGPQHPVLPEPIHLDLVLEDEKVVEAIPSIGFVHRGLEELAGRRDFHDYQYVVERICGICSFKHGMAYCETLEQIFGAEVPPRAKYLRTIWGEMSRIHSHLLWLGLLADAFGFDALFMQCWRMREKVLDMFEASTGGRVIFSVNTIGGVLKDMDSDMLKSFVAIFDDMEKELHSLAHVFLNDYSVQSRLRGVGVLTKEQALLYGAVGPMARASGIEIDTRKLGYTASRHAQDHSRPALARKIRGTARRGLQPPQEPRKDADAQGQSHRSGWLHNPGREQTQGILGPLPAHRG